MSSLYFFILTLETKKINHFLYSVFAGTIAVMVKQDALIFLFVISICFVIADKKWVFPLLLYFAISSCLLFQCFIHYGPYFWTNISLGMHFTYSFKCAILSVFIPSVFRLSYIIIAIGISIRYIINQKQRLYTPLVIIPILMFPIISMLCLKFGAAPVYYTDLLLICFVITFSFLPSNMFYTNKFGSLTLLLLLLSISYDISVSNIYYYMPSMQEKYAEKEADCNALAKIILKQSSENTFILTFNKNLSNHILKQSIFDSYETEFPEFLLSQLTKGNNKAEGIIHFHCLPGQIFDYTLFHKDMQSGRVEYLILDKNSEKPSFLGENFEKFNIYSHTLYFDIYRYSD